MAKKITVRRLLAVAAVLALLAGGALGWDWARRPARLLDALPPVPDCTGRPALQAELLARATARLGSPRTALAGLAELAGLYHANGFTREAEAAWRLLLREQPREPRWSHCLAELRRTAGDPAELGALHARTVALAPDYLPARRHLAEWALKSGQPELAEPHYRHCLTLAPDDPHALLGLVRLAQAREQSAEARRLVEQLVRVAPQFSPGHNLYAALLAAAGEAELARRHRWLGREAGRFREAADPWIEELHALCHEPARLRVLAVVAGQTGRLALGRQLAARAVHLAPTDPAAYEILGGLERQLGEPAAARATLERGLRLAQSPPPSLSVALCETLAELRMPAEALRIAQLGLATAGDAAELHHAAGLALAELGRHAEAATSFRAVLARLPDDAAASHQLGLALVALGRPDEARAALARALVREPTFPPVLTLLGRWELQAGRLAAAEMYLRPLFEAHSEVPAVRRLLADWHLASGTLAERERAAARAEGHYRAGVALDAEHAELQANLGVLLLAADRVPEALAPLEAYARLQPQTAQAALFLGQAYLRLGRAADARRVLLAGERRAREAGQTTTAAHLREMLESR